MVEENNLYTRIKSLSERKLAWQKVSEKGLDLDYTIFIPSDLSDDLFLYLEKNITYFTDKLSRVRVFGKWHDIPRQQVAFGDDGLVYKFSGTAVSALPWDPVLNDIRNIIQDVTNQKFNFVLVNRYRNGSDHIGEHRDDESALDPTSSIASLSFGQPRTFVLKHKDTRNKTQKRQNIPPVKLLLEHGSLLMMNPPTNKIWYHSLPKQKRAKNIRLNLTFRNMI